MHLNYKSDKSITGLLVINVGGIPGADYQFAFFVVCVILVIIIFLEYLLFKWKKWL
jgi:zinc transporter